MVPPYDSDSEEEEEEEKEEEEYTETNVLLGYASKAPTDDDFSQLGGSPEWLQANTPPPASFAKCRVCNGLMNLLLQLNGDLPERFPGHERRLYVFACRRRACARKEGSVRALRCVRHRQIEGSTKASTQTQAPSAQKEGTKGASINLGEALFGAASASSSPLPSNANPFSTSTTTKTSTIAPANPFSTASDTTSSTFSVLASKPAQPPASTTSNLPETFAQKARISSPPPSSAASTARPSSPWPALSSFPPAHPLYNLDADYECLYSEPTSGQSAVPVETIDDAGPSKSNDNNNKSNNSKGQEEDAEAFESTLDKTFQRFADRLAQNPDQVLRYEFDGRPLLYSRTDAVGKLYFPTTSTQHHAGSGSSKIQTKAARSTCRAKGVPRCANCGAERVFEFQLCPQAIVELEEADSQGGSGWDDGMVWGTIIVNVCEKDCDDRGAAVGKVAWFEEWCGVQWEEVVTRR